MNIMCDDPVADLRRTVAELHSKLDERTAEGDVLQRELVAAGKRQTATAEVLQVINSSPCDLASVFGAMLVKARRLCDASFGVLSKIDGNNFSAIAVHGAPPELAEALRQPRQIVPGNAHYRLVHGEDVVQIEDITAEQVWRAGNPARRSLADIGGAVQRSGRYYARTM